MTIDSYRFLDFASRQVMKAWAARQEPGVIPFTPLAKPLRECTVALVSTAAVARNDDRPFDQEGERRSMRQNEISQHRCHERIRALLQEGVDPMLEPAS